MPNTHFSHHDGTCQEPILRKVGVVQFIFANAQPQARYLPAQEWRVVIRDLVLPGNIEGHTVTRETAFAMLDVLWLECFDSFISATAWMLGFIADREEEDRAIMVMANQEILKEELIEDGGQPIGRTL